MAHINKDEVLRVLDVGVTLGKIISKFTDTTLDDITVDWVTNNKDFVAELIVKIAELFGDRQLTEEDFKVMLSSLSLAR